MKRVTITYTRQSPETPWYWQVFNDNLSLVRNFVNENDDSMESSAYVEGNQHIATFTFNNLQVHDQFQALLINTEVKDDYVLYCENNNITIDVVTEDI